MIWQALALVEWWQYILGVLAAACLTVPACWWIEKRVERLDRERWDRLQMRAERQEFYRKAAKR